MINLAKSEQLIRLPKEKLSTVVRALSGHDFCSQHTSLLEKQSHAPCSHCKGGEESPSHLILHCPRYIHYRAQIFGSYTKDIMHTWTASQVACFLSEPSISEKGQCTDDSNLQPMGGNQILLLGYHWWAANGLPTRWYNDFSFSLRLAKSLEGMLFRLRHDWSHTSLCLRERQTQTQKMTLCMLTTWARDLGLRQAYT